MIKKPIRATTEKIRDNEIFLNISIVYSIIIHMRSIKGKVTWIDILKPNEADLAAVKKVHNFHPIILDELLHPSPRIRVEQFDSYLFIVYHFPEYNPELKTSQRTELDFLITKDKIITVHYENIPELNILFDQLSNDESER